MTASELCVTFERNGIPFDLRDVSSMIKRFRERKLARCLNSRRVVGKLHALTDFGRGAVKEAFGIETDPVPRNIDWSKYSQVVSASIRRAVLEEVGKKYLGMHCDKAASAIRKYMRETYPMSLNHVRNALKELMEMELVFVAGYSKRRHLKLYRLTPEGEKILNQMLK